MLNQYTVWEVLDYGPIVAHDMDEGIVITVSHTCFSSWTYLGQGSFIGGTNCLVKELPRKEDCTDFDLVVTVANDWLKEILRLEGEEDDSNN